MVCCGVMAVSLPMTFRAGNAMIDDDDDERVQERVPVSVQLAPCLRFTYHMLQPMPFHRSNGSLR